MTRLTRIATLAAATLAVAAPAASAATGVPAGTVEESSRQIVITGSAGNDQNVFTTQYLTSDRSRIVTRNTADDSLRFESVTSPDVFKAFDAPTNTVTLRDGFDTPPYQSVQQEGASFEQSLAQGCYLETGRTGTFVNYELDAAANCGEPGGHVKVTFDPASHHIITRETTLDGSSFREYEALAYVKTYALKGSAKKVLRFGKHPGAKVVDDRS